MACRKQLARQTKPAIGWLRKVHGCKQLRTKLFAVLDQEWWFFSTLVAFFAHLARSAHRDCGPTCGAAADRARRLAVVAVFTAAMTVLLRLRHEIVVFTECH